MYLNISERLNKFDTYVLFTIKKHVQNKYLDILMPIITSMANLGAIWIIMAVVLLLDKPYRMVGDIVLITLIMSTAVGEGIVKHLVRRTRPCNKQKGIKLLISKPISYSFPSGHTLSSFAAAGVLSAYFTEYRLIFIIIAFVIALSRIYLYVHYPTDVIAGIIFGLLCSKLVLIILQEQYFTKLIILFKNI